MVHISLRLTLLLALASTVAPRESAFVSLGLPTPAVRALRGQIAQRGTRHQGSVLVSSSKVKMSMMQFSTFPDLFGRMSLRDTGNVSEQREELNRLHVARERLIERIKRTMRAASYDFGGQDWGQLFTQFDKDRNGILDFFEFEQLFRHMGLQSTQLSADELHIVFEEVDPERKGQVEVSSFTAWLSGKKEKNDNVVMMTSSNVCDGESCDKVDSWTFGENVVEDESDPREFAALMAQATRLREDIAPAAQKVRTHAIQREGSRELGKAVGTVDALVPKVSAFVDAPSNHIRDSIYFFRNQLNLPENKIMGLAISAPSLFSMSVEGMIRPQVEYMKEIGISGSRIGRMLVAFPQLFEINHDKKVATVEFLEGLGIPTHSVGKVLSQQPRLLGLSVESKLQPAVEFLVSECRVPRKKIGQLISSFPTVLAYSIETNLRPKVAFLLEELEVPVDRLAGLVLKFPQFLGLGIETNLLPTIKYLTSEVGISKKDVCKIVQNHPQIIGLSVEKNLKPKIMFLTKELGVPHEKLSKIISAFPTLLSLSISMNLRPKVDYLTKEAGYSREEILKAPHLLAYSLTQRMQPRIEFMRKQGMDIALHSLLSLSNSDFARRYDFKMKAAA